MVKAVTWDNAAHRIRQTPSAHVGLAGRHTGRSLSSAPRADFGSPDSVPASFHLYSPPCRMLGHRTQKGGELLQWDTVTTSVFARAQSLAFSQELG
jgi:hypothetical protein